MLPKLRSRPQSGGRGTGVGVAGWAWHEGVTVAPPPRLTPNGKDMRIRVFITSDNGVSVRPHMYREVEDPRTGEVCVCVQRQ